MTLTEEAIEVIELPKDEFGAEYAHAICSACEPSFLDTPKRPPFVALCGHLMFAPAERGAQSCPRCASYIALGRCPAGHEVLDARIGPSAD